MKSLILALFAVLLLFGVAHGASSVLINSATWDAPFKYWTSADSLMSDYGISSVLIENGPVLTDNPPIRVSNFAANIPTDTAFLAMTGHTVVYSTIWGDVYCYMPEFYDTWSAVVLAAADYDAVPLDELIVVDVPRSGATALRGFAVTSLGISNQLVPRGLNSGAIVYAGYCVSEVHAAGWRCSRNVQSFTGYSTTENFARIQYNLANFVWRITCHPVEDAAHTKYRFPSAMDAVRGGNNAENPELKLGGNIICNDSVDITLAAAKSGCSILDVALDFLGVDGEYRAYLGVATKSEQSCYILHLDSAADTLTCNNTDRYDHHGRAVVWFDLPANADTLEVTESLRGATVSSTGVWGVSQLPPCTLDSLYTEEEISDVQLTAQQAAAIDDSLSSSGSGQSGYDALVVARDGELADIVVDDLEAQGKTVFRYVNAAISPTLIRYFYNRIVDGNAQTGGGWPVDPGPTLYLAGSAPMIRYGITLGDVSECGGQCFSDLLLTDTDGDWVPDGPVTRIPGYTAQEVAAVLAAAADYRTGTTVNPQRRVAFFCDDQDYGYVLNMRTIAGYYDAIGYSDGAVIKLSQMPHGDQARFGEFCDIVNAGIAELWAFGYSSDHMWGSMFKLAPYGPVQVGEFNQLTTDQVFIAWAPTCHTALTRDNMESSSLAGALMLPGAGNASRLAGFVGRVSGGGDVAEYLLACALAAARRDAVPDVDSLAEVVYRGVTDFIGEYPMFRDLALGTSVLGGNVVLRGIDEAADTALGSLELNEIEFSACSTGEQTLFRYRRNGSIEARGELVLYNIRGQLVRRLDAGALQESSTISWDGRDGSGRLVASGVYLGLLVARSARGSVECVTKATIVR